MTDANTAKEGRQSEIHERREGHVAIVTIHRPHRKNALDGNAWRDIGLAFRKLSADREVRAILLHGSGDAFCAGDDLHAFEEVRHIPDQRETYWNHIMECLAAVAAARVPVVCAIRGVCVGGGLSIALRCDFRLADASSKFLLPPAKLGLVYPADSTHLLAAAVGIARAKRLLYTGEAIGAAEAQDIGLIQQIADGDVVQAALEFLAPIVRNAPLSIEAAKIACDSFLLSPSSQAVDAVTALHLRANASEDYTEGVTAFREKRPPVFKGR